MAAPTIGSTSTTSAPPSRGNALNGQALGPAGNPNDAPTGSVNDLFAQLKEFVWKGISVPVAEFDTEIRQDLVVHKYADRNGAFVEGMGRHPAQITARIPFLNYIFNAAGESWPPGALYPYQWRLFFKACLEGTSGTLQHPELGPLNCKLDVTRTAWSGPVRGGVWTTATWVESDDTQADQLGQDLSQASPITNVVASADDLDAQIATLQAALTLQANPLPALQYSFSQLGAQLAGVINTTTLLQDEYQGAANNIIFQANEVEEALSLASAASPLNWPIFQNCERLKAAAYALQAAPPIASSAAGTLTLLVVAKDSTMAQLIAQTGSDPATFIQLNYGLVGQPVVPKGATVQYYKQAA